MMSLMSLISFASAFAARPARAPTSCIFAASGAEALDRLSGKIQPTLVAVLSDINMPGMDGLQLLGEIKQRFPDLPVMLVTAEHDAAIAEFNVAAATGRLIAPELRLPVRLYDMGRHYKAVKDKWIGFTGGLTE